MKEAIIIAGKYLMYGILVVIAFLGIMSLALAMPSILEWLSGYIGTATTWILFLFIVGSILYSFVAEK